MPGTLSLHCVRNPVPVCLGIGPSLPLRAPQFPCYRFTKLFYLFCVLLSAYPTVLQSLALDALVPLYLASRDQKDCNYQHPPRLYLFPARPFSSTQLCLGPGYF